MKLARAQTPFMRPLGLPRARSVSISPHVARSTRISVTEKLKDAPDLRSFLQNDHVDTHEDLTMPQVPYLVHDPSPGAGRSVFVESYGCQMNMSDSEIVSSIMKSSGFVDAVDADKADIVFLNTCAIRENAENKIWARLRQLKGTRRNRGKAHPLIVGVLGCMAERLKTKLIEEEGLVDLVAGPDAYRDLPRLLSKVDEGERSINVILSQDETYADITPVRTASNGVSAFVSIMRGCNNMCTYCIVPFTRGRERSRAAASIEAEVRDLSRQGYKEIVLLGQNVNSYNDLSEVEAPEALSPANYAPGFGTVYKKPHVGVSFAQLVDRLAQIDPEMRIRYTSPHPKDFPDELLFVIRDRPNVCKSIHIPAQSGSSTNLERMRRGYSREAYLALIDRIREIIPNITLSSDFISGFCVETEEEHQETITLLESVQYEFAFMFAYSMREKTPAHRRYQDDVPDEVKRKRLIEVIDTFQKHSVAKNKAEIGSRHLVLVEGPSKKSVQDWAGRSDSNKKVVFPVTPVLDLREKSELSSRLVDVNPGDYVVVDVVGTTGLALQGIPRAVTTLSQFARGEHNNLPHTLHESENIVIARKERCKSDMDL